MKFSTSHRATLFAILSDTYTPFDVRAFIHLCYTFALPFIRKKISLGKLRLDILGLRETDLIHDCIADLFTRDESGSFGIIKSYFQRQQIIAESANDDELLLGLRRLVFGQVHKSVIRLYSEGDELWKKYIDPAFDLEISNAAAFVSLADVDDDGRNEIILARTVPVPGGRKTFRPHTQGPGHGLRH